MISINASDKVYDYIIEKLKSREWKPNEKIMTENELCIELGVSRIAVREALGRFVALGILTKKKGAGTFVTDLNISMILSKLIPLILLNDMDLISVLEYRIHFEYGNILMFMENYEEHHVEELENYYKEMEENVDNPEKFYTADFKFHSTINIGTKNSLAIVINEILMEVLVTHQATLNSYIGPDIGLEYHKSILSAIKMKDTKLAALLMRRHIEAAKGAAIKAINKKS